MLILIFSCVYSWVVVLNCVLYLSLLWLILIPNDPSRKKLFFKFFYHYLCENGFADAKFKYRFQSIQMTLIVLYIEQT